MKKVWISVLLSFILIGIGTGITVTEVLSFKPVEINPTEVRIVKEQLLMGTRINDLPECEYIVDQQYLDTYILEVTIPKQSYFYLYDTHYESSYSNYNYVLHPSESFTNLYSFITDHIKNKTYPIYSSEYFTVQKCRIITSQNNIDELQK